jgi:carboxyl-terminal processing protease
VTPSIRRFVMVALLSVAALARAGSAENYFRQIITYLEDAYIEPERLNDPRPLLRQALRALENAADEIMVEELSDPLGLTYRIRVGDGVERVSEREVKTPTDLWRALERIMRFVETKYRGSTPVDDLRYAMANGMTSALDPHTNVFSPKQYKEFFVHIEGEICGVGAYIGVRDGKLVIISPLKDSPAQKAGDPRGR